MVYTKVKREQPIHDKGVLMVTAFLVIFSTVVSNHGVSAYTGTIGEGKPSSSDVIFFRVLKGDLNVCTPDYNYNVTVCQMVMKAEELSPYVNGGENSTNSSNYPPLSVDPEMVINEQELQEMLTNRSLGTFEKDESIASNDTGSSNATIAENVTKIYVDGYPEYQPLVTGQPLEDEIINNNSLQIPADDNQQQQPFIENQTLLNEVHESEEELGLNEAIDQQDNYPGSILEKDSSNPQEDIDNPKADTSNSYSSIPIAMSLPLRTNN